MTRYAILILRHPNDPDGESDALFNQTACVLELISQNDKTYQRAARVKRQGNTYFCWHRDALQYWVDVVHDHITSMTDKKLKTTKFHVIQKGE